MIERITLKNVDVYLLEQQRKILATIPREALTEMQRAALDGIQNMLDSWSDEEYYNKIDNHDFHFIGEE